jgi:hypothetical protein
MDNLWPHDDPAGNGWVLRLGFNRLLNLEFHGKRTELERITMNFKKFFFTEPTPATPVVEVDAAHEASRKAGYEAGRAEGYEVGYKQGYDEGSQIALEAKKPQKPPPPERLSRPESPVEEPQSS